MAKPPLKIDTLTHKEASRLNAPTAELEAFVDAETRRPILAAYQRRNPDLDPQLVWRGKDVADWSDLVVTAPPLYIQEKIHPKAILNDLRRQQAASSKQQAASSKQQAASSKQQAASSKQQAASNTRSIF